MLQACITTQTTGPAVIDTSCKVFTQISYSCPQPLHSEKTLCAIEGDTAETVEEIKKHNAKYNDLCTTLHNK